MKAGAAKRAFGTSMEDTRVPVCPVRPVGSKAPCVLRNSAASAESRLSALARTLPPSVARQVVCDCMRARACLRVLGSQGTTLAWWRGMRCSVDIAMICPCLPYPHDPVKITGYADGGCFWARGTLGTQTLISVPRLHTCTYRSVRCHLGFKTITACASRLVVA